MSNYLSALDLNLSDDSPGAAHRRAALEATPWAPAPTTRVSYTAANRLLIVADAATAGELKAQLPAKLLAYTAIPAAHSGAVDDADVYHCAGLALDGYLGRFTATFDPSAGDERRNLAAVFNIHSALFDQVLDCGIEPLVKAAVKPPGYHHAGQDADAQAAAIARIPQLLGEFEKPKYFDYDPDICAHGRSGLKGCTRCIDACPSEAIFSRGETVEVIAHLCQGGGACAAVCPSAAIEYAYPRADEHIELLRALLKSLRRENSNHGITLLVFDNERGRAAVDARAAQLAGHILPFVVEEIGSVGLDFIACALAYGASRVCLYAPADTPAQVVDALRSNLAVVATVVAHTGAPHRAQLLTDPADLTTLDDAPAAIERAATFAPVGDKRARIRAALSFLYDISPEGVPPAVTELPKGAPFGEVRLDVPACTLCMGCVSVCPAGALQAGGDRPALHFIEGNCVQCGICATACPERALSLAPRLQFDPRAATTARALKEESPFCCVQCGKPFATEVMIARMTEKLRGHWMFAEPNALRRLKMCEDCRVKDLFDKENKGL